MLGTRDPGKLDGWRSSANPDGRVGYLEDAARFGQVVVLSVLGSAVENGIRLAGVESLAGKVLIDASDPLTSPPGAPGCSSAQRTPSASASNA